MYERISREVFLRGIPMERVYEIFRICLHMSLKDERYSELKEKIMETYRNENLEKMNAYYSAKARPPERKPIMKPQLLAGDAEEMLRRLPEKSVQLIFTSPPSVFGIRIKFDDVSESRLDPASSEVAS